MKRLGRFLRSLADRVDPPAPSYQPHPYGATSISEMVRECEAIKREAQAEYGCDLTNIAFAHESAASKRLRWEIEALDNSHRVRKLKAVPQ